MYYKNNIIKIWASIRIIYLTINSNIVLAILGKRLTSNHTHLLIYKV